MADEYLKDQDPFAGSSIQDTDLFWISVDNGDTTFSTYKITGLQLKQLLPNIYTEDGTINVAREVIIDDTTGQLDFYSTICRFSIDGDQVILSRNNVSAPTTLRQIIMNSTHLEIRSNKISYDRYQVYQGTKSTTSDTPEFAVTVTPVVPTNFQIQAEVKGFYAGTSKVYYARIDALYKTISGTTTLIDSSPFVQESPSSGMSATLVISGTDVALQVTGVSGQVVNWTYIVKVF